MDGALDADGGERAAGGQQGPIVTELRRAFGRGVTATGCPASQSCPRAWASWRRSRWFSSASSRSPKLRSARTNIAGADFTQQPPELESGHRDTSTVLTRCCVPRRSSYGFGPRFGCPTTSRYSSVRRTGRQLTRHIPGVQRWTMRVGGGWTHDAPHREGQELGLVAWCGDAVTARRIHSMPRPEGFVGVPVVDSDAVDGADVAIAAGDACPSDLRAELPGITSRRRRGSQATTRVAEVREVFDDGFVVVDEQCGDASLVEPVPGAQEVFPLAARGARDDVFSPVTAKRAAAHVNVFNMARRKQLNSDSFEKSVAESRRSGRRLLTSGLTFGSNETCASSLIRKR